MSAEENKALMRRFWEVWEEGDIDRLDELLAPDYVNHTLAAPDLPPGPEGVKEVVRMFRSGMPNLSGLSSRTRSPRETGSRPATPWGAPTGPTLRRRTHGKAPEHKKHDGGGVL